MSDGGKSGWRMIAVFTGIIAYWSGVLLGFVSPAHSNDSLITLCRT